MNIGEFTALDREAQFAEAGRIAGTNPSVFDGIWRTESGRGAAMLSPAGAEGHFGLMPKTRKTMEGRFGTTIDPYNFGQALFTSAHLLKENLGKFPKLPDALRAYNGGWDASKWGNPETAAYAAKVLGSDTEADTTAMGNAPLAAAPVSTPAVSGAASLWDKPFARDVKPPKAVPTGTSKAVTALLDIGGLPAPAGPQTFNVFTQASAEQAASQLKTKQQAEDTSFMDAARAAAFGTAPVALLQMLYRDPEPATPGYKVTEEQLKGFELGDQRDLVTANSQKQYDRMVFDKQYGKDQDAITFRNGTLFGLGASFLAAAPEAMLSGGVASIGFAKAGVGAARLATAGDKGMALAASLGEGVVGNVVNTAALDMLGKRQGTEAYALGALGGLLNPMLQGSYLGRMADRANDVARIERGVVEAAAREARIMDSAKARLPEGHTPEDLQAMMKTVEAEGLRSDIQSHKAAIPESRKMVAGEVEEAVPESAAATEGSINNAANESIAPPFESPDFQARRIALAETNPQWQADFKAVGGMDYTTAKATLPKGVSLTPDMEALVTKGSPAFKNAISAVRDLAAEYLGPDSQILIGARLSDRGMASGANGEMLSAGNVHFMGVRPEGAAKPTGLNHTVFHELGHAIYHQHAPTAPPELLARISADWEAFVKKAQAGDVSARQDRLAVTHPSRFDPTAMKTTDYALNRDEYMAEQFVTHLQNRALAGEHGKLSTGTINQIINGVKAVLGYVLDLVRRGEVKPGKGADEFFKSVLEGSFAKKAASEQFLAPELQLPTIEAAAASSDIPPKLAGEVRDFLNDPVAQKHGLDRLPMGTTAERAEAKQILALYKKADSAEYSVDNKRLSTLLSKVDSLNPTSNTMLRSKNPVVRMAAIELLENGGGAAGRRSTASIAKWSNERAIVGNTIVDLDREFRGWFKDQPNASNMKEAFSGQKRAEFNRLVAEEIEQRRYPGQRTDLGDRVRAAADSMEQSFERARLMQVDAKTAGWAALPESSQGYMPHRIKSNVYRDLSLSQKRALHQELTDQFITVSGYDMGFADQLASKYLDRVEQRALGGFDSPMGMHQTGAADVIREALEQMNLSRPEVDAMMKRHVAGAASHTKKRLNLDLRKEITLDDGSSFRLLDMYDTDMLSLMRGQSQRVAGEVALARHGVMGKPGLAILRRAMGYGGDGEQAVLKEVGAFDQISAEFLGSPFGEVNKWVDRATQFNSISSLGGMGFNQLGESINIAMTLGVKASLSHVAEFGRLRSEVLKLAQGGKVDNPILASIETMGGAEFGTDAYKMVFPLDNPDLFGNSLGADSISGGDRLLRGAGHLQSKLSLWRAIHSTQVRAVAEQIVLKTAKALKTGDNDFHLRDMGVSDDVLERLRKDFKHVVTMKDGQVTGFDITKAADKEAAHEFIQAVHRGGSQIIQGSFIGETGKYAHSSWLRLLTQFRSFGLTAIDKQWNRQVGNRGISGALIVTIAAMSAAAPLYLARTYLASIGRKDQDEYLAKQTSFGAIARATTNYIATSGLAGDFLDAASALTGTGELTGGRSGTATTLTGNLMGPALGKADKLWGAIQNTKDGTDPHALIKELPLSRLPFLIPAINALGN